MTITQLRYFYTVAKTGHLSNAAMDMNVSQSTVSMSLQQLEDEVSAKLFEKQGRLKKLTPAGEIFLQHIKTILDELEIAQNDLSAVSANKPLNIHLGLDILDAIIPGEIEFLKRNPHVNLYQSYMPTLQLVKKIESKEIDFGITHTSVETGSLEFTPFLSERIGLLVPAEHELAERDSVQISELAPFQFITMPIGSSYRKMTDEFFRYGKFHPDIRAEAVHMQMLYSMVMANLGIAFISDGGWVRNIAPPFDGSNRNDFRPQSFDWRNRLKIIPIIDDICRRTFYICNLKRRNIPMEKWYFYLFFCEYFQDVEQEQIEFRKSIGWE